MNQKLKAILRICVGILLSPCLLGLAVLALLAIVSFLLSMAVNFLAGEEEPKEAWKYGHLQ